MHTRVQVTDRPRELGAAWIVAAIRAGAGEDEPERRRMAAAAGDEQVEPGALRILIVEDEAILALSLASMVEEMGHSVVGLANGGAKAIADAGRLGPDVVLMDVRLADEVDGITAAEQILATRPIAVVFISAYSDSVTLDRIRQLDAPILGKPVDQRRLEVALENVSRRRD